MRFRHTLLVIFLVFCASFACAKPKITIATSTWEPYVSDDPAYHGYVYEIVRNAFETAGYDVDIKFMGWDKAERALKLGLVDAIFPEYYSKDRSAQLIFSDPFSGGPIGFFKISGSKIEFPNKQPTKNLRATLGKMRHFRFGVVKGYSNVAAFDDNETLIKRYVDSDRANLEQLYAGQVDMVIIDKYTAEYLIKHELPWNYQIKLTFMNPPLGYKKLHVAVSRQHTHQHNILAAFNRGLAKIKANGQLSQIIDQDALMNGEQVA